MKNNLLSMGRLASRIGMTCAVASILAHTTQAADQNWDGGISTDWQDSLNWNAGGGPVPITGDNAVFASVFLNQPTLTADSAQIGLWLKTGLAQDVTLGGAFTLNLLGSTTINSLANTAILLDDSLNHNLTIGSGTTTAVLTSTSFRVNNTGTLTVQGPLAITDGQTLTLAGTAAGTTSISGSTTATTGIIAVNTTGKAILSGTNLHSGGTTLTAGTLQIGNDSAAGTGTLTLTGGTLSSDSVAARNLTNAVSFGGNVALGDVTNSGTLTFAGAGTLTANRTLTVNSPVIYSGNIGGAFGLIKAGAGALTLSGTNAYTTFTLTSGQVNLNSANALGSGAVTITTGTIDNTSGSAVTLATNGAITLNGNLTFAGSNNLTFGSGNLSTSGSRTITLQGTSKTLTFGGDFKFTNSGANSTLTVDGPGNTIVFKGLQINPANQQRNNVVTGTGNITLTGGFYDGGTPSSGDSLTYSGSGTFTLGGASNITSPTSIKVASGTVLINNADALKGGVLVSTGGSIQFGTGIGTFNMRGLGASTAGLVLQDTASNPVTLSLNGTGSGTPNTTFDQVLSGSGAIIVAGTQAQTFSAQNTFTGGTTVGAGILQLKTSSTVTGGVVASGPVGTGTLTLGNGSTLRSDTTTARTLQNNLSLSGTINIGAASSQTGAITINSTGLTVPSTVVLTADTALTVLSTATISNVISGGSALTKAGASTLNLGAANTFTGVTKVTAGTLALGNFNALQNSPYDVTGGGAVTLTAGAGTYVLGGLRNTLGTGAVGTTLAAGANSITLNSTAQSAVTISNITDFQGSGAAIAVTTSGAFTLDGTLTLNITTTFADGTYTFNIFEGNTAGTFTSVSLTGSYAATLNAGNGYSSIVGGNTYSFNNGTGELTMTLAAIPEPSSVAMAIAGLLGVMVVVRRRRMAR